MFVVVTQDGMQPTTFFLGPATGFYFKPDFVSTTGDERCIVLQPIDAREVRKD